MAPTAAPAVNPAPVEADPAPAAEDGFNEDFPEEDSSEDSFPTEDIQQEQPASVG